MSDMHVSLTLTFATAIDPASVAAAAMAAIASEMGPRIVAASWTTYDLFDEADCTHTAWEEKAIQLPDGRPAAGRTCADCGERLPALLTAEADGL
ncbi:hypothetical protein ACIQU5_28005 [Streptomyces sp. NPDC090306]|uniref:hypothetical protein n=1 Tax=Streptomyces sp. NPDC090306 TaxID=3365961 RepID=UPI00380F1A4F